MEEDLNRDDDFEKIVDFLTSNDMVKLEFTLQWILRRQTIRPVDTQAIERFLDFCKLLDRRLGPQSPKISATAKSKRRQLNSVTKVIFRLNDPRRRSYLVLKKMSVRPEIPSRAHRFILKHLLRSIDETNWELNFWRQIIEKQTKINRPITAEFIISLLETPPPPRPQQQATLWRTLKYKMTIGPRQPTPSTSKPKPERPPRPKPPPKK